MEINMDKNFTAIRHYIQAIQALSFESSRNHNNGEVCYPYAYGYSSSQFHTTLARLDLNKKQLKELSKITDGLLVETVIEGNVRKRLTEV